LFVVKVLRIYEGSYGTLNVQIVKMVFGTDYK